jgi:hypothetical protein
MTLLPFEGKIVDDIYSRLGDWISYIERLADAGKDLRGDFPLCDEVAKHLATVTVRERDDVTTREYAVYTLDRLIGNRTYNILERRDRMTQYEIDVEAGHVFEEHHPSAYFSEKKKSERDARVLGAFVSEAVRLCVGDVDRTMRDRLIALVREHIFEKHRDVISSELLRNYTGVSLLNLLARSAYTADLGAMVAEAIFDKARDTPRSEPVRSVANGQLEYRLEKAVLKNANRFDGEFWQAFFDTLKPHSDVGDGPGQVRWFNKEGLHDDLVNAAHKSKVFREGLFEANDVERYFAEVRDDEIYAQFIVYSLKQKERLTSSIAQSQLYHDVLEALLKEENVLASLEGIVYQERGMSGDLVKALKKLHHVTDRREVLADVRRLLVPLEEMGLETVRNVARLASAELLAQTKAMVAVIH